MKTYSIDIALDLDAPVDADDGSTGLVGDP